MPITQYKIYTAKGYEGELVDSGPRVVQTGILTSVKAGFGKALKRDTAVGNGVALGSAANVYAISQREYNHEAGVRPSDGNDTYYLKTESVSIIREGFLYLTVTGGTDTVTGTKVHVNTVTGKFTMDAVSSDDNIIATTNVTAEETVTAGSIFKARIDIVA